MTAELDIQDCVYCGQTIDSMPSLNKIRELYPLGVVSSDITLLGLSANLSISATYYCGHCQSNFTLYFAEDENGNVTKF